MMLILSIAESHQKASFSNRFHLREKTLSKGSPVPQRRQLVTREAMQAATAQ